jgi:hypothetical protein
MSTKYHWIPLKLVLVIGLLSALACTPQNQLPQQITPGAATVSASWYTLSHHFFISKSHNDIRGFAKSLNETLAIPNANADDSPTIQKLIAKSILTRSPSSDTGNPARVAVERQINQQFLAHQLASFGSVLLSQNDRMFIKQNPQWATYVQSLTTLSQNFEVFTQGDLEIYEADNVSGLFAYKRTQGTTRAFIAFNFSFDQHELPLPFGFMASTKVTMWQSDSTDIQTFVTSQALTIRPYTAVIVIVG